MGLFKKILYEVSSFLIGIVVSVGILWLSCGGGMYLSQYFFGSPINIAGIFSFSIIIMSILLGVTVGVEKYLKDI